MGSWRCKWHTIKWGYLSDALKGMLEGTPNVERGCLEGGGDGEFGHAPPPKKIEGGRREPKRRGSLKSAGGEGANRSRHTLKVGVLERCSKRDVGRHPKCER